MTSRTASFPTPWCGLWESFCLFHILLNAIFHNEQLCSTTVTVTEEITVSLSVVIQPRINTIFSWHGEQPLVV